MIRALFIAAATSAVVAGGSVATAPVACAAGPYANCSQAKADGRCDIPKGDPDYWPGGDRDNDRHRLRVLTPLPGQVDDLRAWRVLLHRAGICAVGAVAMMATVTSPPTVAADPIATTALVLNVVDGDTIDIRDDSRGRLRVRLLGIDTPETKKPNFTVGCWAPEATEFAKSTMLGQRVAVVTDPTQGRTDRYGRTLAYLVRADGWDYSVEAARAGAAHSYVYAGNPASRYDAIEAAERKPEMPFVACGVRPASATQHQYRSEARSWCGCRRGFIAA